MTYSKGGGHGNSLPFGTDRPRHRTATILLLQLPAKPAKSPVAIDSRDDTTVSGDQLTDATLICRQTASVGAVYKRRIIIAYLIRVLSSDSVTVETLQIYQLFL